MDTRQNLAFGFGSVSPKKRGFGFKTDPGLPGTPKSDAGTALLAVEAVPAFVHAN